MQRGYCGLLHRLQRHTLCRTYYIPTHINFNVNIDSYVNGKSVKEEFIVVLHKWSHPHHNMRPHRPRTILCDFSFSTAVVYIWDNFFKRLARQIADHNVLAQ